MTSRDWDPEKMLRLYIHDYMITRGMHGAAEIFKNEAQLPNNAALLHSQEGFLHEWWSVFHASFTSRQRNDQENGPESSSNVVQRPQQFQSQRQR